ncbi:MAG: hypothetical protein KDA91_20755 [Planctomycetaceae bacterium]|nr:hypothetical protein [Planctomycetaceae bacterium]
MEDFNPYAPPVDQAVSVESVRGLPVRRRLALAMLWVFIIAAVSYTYLDEVVLATSFGAWPMLCTAGAGAIVASCFTRDLLVAPLCCLLSVVCGDLTAAFVKSWQYAQFHLCLPLAIGFSVPSFLLAFYLRFRKRHNIP